MLTTIVFLFKTLHNGVVMTKCGIKSYKTSFFIKKTNYLRIEVNM